MAACYFVGGPEIHENDLEEHIPCFFEDLLGDSIVTIFDDMLMTL